ncbi:Aspartate aminotransferase-like [Homarus americanus]|uniref:Aspartate aminotransferase-like n=1 Tax=Homarus americanus TaxID=6706 RepID=A0A8J5N6G6_HOMAM|nr:Aspartate aminotransferase-like [Homarus americanus]
MKENATLKGLVRPDLANSSAASNLAFNEQVKALIRSGRKVYHFAFGQSPFPIPECMTKAVQEYAHVHDYLPMVGIPELREELVKFHARYDNLSLSSDNFTVGPGSKELIFLVMATFNGDILLPAPTWTTYMAQCRLAGKEPRVLEMKQAKGWKLAPETLEEAARQGGDGWKLLVLTSPGNPKGTILISGFSKWASAGGWRLGYAHFPPSLRPLLEAVRNAASHTYSCAPAPMQYGVAKALRENGNELDKYMTNCAKILQAAGDYCHRELASVGVDGCRSQAGYYFVPDFEVVREGLRARGLTTGDHMTQAMLEEADVALMSTHPFLRPAEELTTRFCFVCFDGCSALRALDDLPSPSHHLSDDFLHKHCLPIVQGIQNLKEWVLKYRQE